MRKLSAVEAVAPAWALTRDFLIAPRNWRLLLKVGLIASLSQLGSFNFNVHSPSSFGSDMSPATASLLVVFFLVGIALFGLAIGLVFFYLGSRFQFVFFEIVLRRDAVIGPMWRRYGPVTWRWVGFKLLYFLLALICVAVLFIPFIAQIVHLAQLQSGFDNLNFQQIFPLLLSFLVPLLLALLLVGAGYATVFYFCLPFIALENLSIGQTTRRVWGLLCAEPGAFALYLLMLVLLGLGVGMLALLVFVLCIAIVGVPLGIVGTVLWFALHQAGTVASVIMGLCFAALGLIALAAVLVVVLAITACQHTFFQAYALYFLGGRYPQLGDRLDGFNPPLPPVTASPLYPEPYPPPPSTYPA